MQTKGLMEEIQHAKNAGVAIDVQGVSYNQKETDELCRVLQQGNYMLDYEGDEKGRIIALHIDSIEPSKKTPYKNKKQ